MFLKVSGNIPGKFPRLKIPGNFATLYWTDHSACCHSLANKFLNIPGGHELGVDICGNQTNIPANCTSYLLPIDQRSGMPSKFVVKIFPRRLAMLCMVVKHSLVVDEMMACLWFEKAWNTLDNTKTVQCCFEKAGFKLPQQVLIIISASEAAELPMVPEYDGGIALFTEENDAIEPVPLYDPKAVMDLVQPDAIDQDLAVSETSNESGGEEGLESSLISSKHALSCIVDLQKFYMEKGMMDEAQWMSNQGSIITLMYQNFMIQGVRDYFHQ